MLHCLSDIMYVNLLSFQRYKSVVKISKFLEKEELFASFLFKLVFSALKKRKK